MFNNPRDESMVQKRKHFIRNELKILKETDSKKLKQLNQNFSLINTIPSFPNNFSQVIKEAISDIQEETGNKISQFEFFAEYCDEYEDNSSILSSFNSYFKNSRPAPVRMTNILNFINNKLPKKHTFDPTIDEDIQKIIYKMYPDPKNPLDKEFQYFNTIFKNREEVLNYLNNVINNSFNSVFLLLDNLQVITRSSNKIHSWIELEWWIKADTRIRSTTKQKFQLVKKLLQMETQINNYKLFNNSQINSFPFQINSLDLILKPITKDKLKMLNAVGLKDMQLLKDTTFPNFKINNMWRKNYSEIYHFINQLEKSEDTLDKYSNSLNASYTSEYMSRIEGEDEFPQFNEKEFVFKNTITILTNFINDYLHQLKPKYYDRFLN